MKLSIKYKVPLFFALAIVTTVIISVLVLAFFSNSKESAVHKNIIRRFAYENSSIILSKDQDALQYQMMLWGKEDEYLVSLFMVDNKFGVVALHDPEKMIEVDQYQQIRESFLDEESAYYRFDHNHTIILKRLEINGMEIGIIGGIFNRLNFFQVLLEMDQGIKVSVTVFFIVGLILVIIISVSLSRQIVDPIMEISQFINENNHLSPEHIQNIKIKNKKCWVVKNCKKKSCINYKNNTNNCWDTQMENATANAGNPMLTSCFDCSVFLSREDDEIDRLKIFLNHLISRMRYHYKQSKQYSVSLEDKVKRRTSELRLMADDLISANLKTKLVLENVAEGIIVVNPDGIIVQVNEEAKKDLFIKQAEGGLGKKFQDVFIDKDSGEKINELIIRTISMNKGYEEEVAFGDLESKKNLVIRTTIVHNEHLDEKYVILLLCDFTDQKIVDNFKNDFFHMISHDLKNPLASVMGFLDLLHNGAEHEALSDKQKQYIEVATRSSSDLKMMLDDLSKIIKLQSDSLQLDKREFVLNDLFEELAQSFYPVFLSKNAEFVSRVSPRRLKVNGDYVRLKQALSNLIGNAIKTGENIKISLDAVKVGSNIVIAIEDNGVGISEDKLPLIFERFKQLYTYQTNDAGMGLGLTIVKTIINLHNGHIAVESQVNKGTKFIITLPHHG